MIRVDPSNWTADFRIARALAEAYSASGLDDVLFFCTGDPADRIGALGSMVADETLKYFPNVVGLSEDPITSANFEARAEAAASRWPEAFVVAIEAGTGRSAHLGSIEITDRPLSSVGNSELLGHFGDVTVNAVLRMSEVKGVLRAGGSDSRSAKGLREAAREVGSDDEAPSAGRKGFKPLLPEQVNRSVIRKIADVIIDGNLRFLSKIGKQEL